METAKAAAFFLCDGVILTGSHTGAAVDMDEFRVRGSVGKGKAVTPGERKSYISYIRRQGKAPLTWMSFG